MEMTDAEFEAAVGVTEPLPVVSPGIAQGVQRMETMNAIVADAQRKSAAYVAAFKIEGGGE